MPFPQKANPTPLTSICPRLVRDLGGHTVRCGKKTPLIWSFWLERISPTKRRDLRPFERKCYKNWQNDPVPPETAHPGSPIELSAHELEQLIIGRGVLWWLAVAADGKHESALGKGFPDPCRGRSLGRPAPFEPMKLPSEACILRQSARQLSAASGAPPSHPIKSSFAGIGPTASQGLR